MPICVECYSDDKYEYSTALMFAYINLKKPEKIKLETSKLLFNLDLECWDKNTKPHRIPENPSGTRVFPFHPSQKTRGPVGQHSGKRTTSE